MARTFRRRNIEASNGTADGHKFGGFWRQREYLIPQPFTGHGGKWDYRAPTPQEKNRDYWRAHKDGLYFGNCSNATPSLRPRRHYRQHFDTDLKTHDEGELRRYLAQPDDYEPQFWGMKPVDWREWD
jgi:hypothetical protein